MELVRTLAIDDSREKDRIKVTVASGVKRGPDGSPGETAGSDRGVPRPCFPPAR